MLERGRVVVSAAGRDKGRLLAVVGHDNGAVLVCDGKERPLKRAKRKNPRHLIPTEHRIDEDSLATDLRLRRTLRQFKI
ncbi:MAG: hypothetical protein ACI4SB_07845 [Acutalibacteraceae bacterium]